MAAVLTITREQAQQLIKDKNCSSWIDEVRIVDEIDGGVEARIEVAPTKLYRTLHESGDWADWFWVETQRDSGLYRCGTFRDGAPEWAAAMRNPLPLDVVVLHWGANPDVCFEPLPVGLAV